MLTNANSKSPSAKNTAVESACSPEHLQESRRFPISGLKNNDDTIATDVSLSTQTKTYDVSADGACMYRAYFAARTKDRSWLSCRMTNRAKIRDKLEASGHGPRIIGAIKTAITFFLSKADPNLVPTDGLFLENIFEGQSSPLVRGLLMHGLLSKLNSSDFAPHLYCNTIGNAAFTLWQKEGLHQQICHFANIKKEDRDKFVRLSDALANLIAGEIIKELDIPIDINSPVHLRAHGLHYNLVAPSDYFSDIPTQSMFIQGIQEGWERQEHGKSAAIDEEKSQCDQFFPAISSARLPRTSQPKEVAQQRHDEASLKVPLVDFPATNLLLQFSQLASNLAPQILPQIAPNPNLKSHPLGSAYLKDGSLQLPFSILPPLSGDQHYLVEYTLHRNLEELRKIRGTQMLKKKRESLSEKIKELNKKIDMTNNKKDVVLNSLYMDELIALEKTIETQKGLEDKVTELVKRSKELTVVRQKFKANFHQYARNSDTLFSDKSRLEQDAAGSKETGITFSDPVNLLKEKCFGVKNIQKVIFDLIYRVENEARNNAEIDVGNNVITDEGAIDRRAQAKEKAQENSLPDMPLIEQESEFTEIQVENIVHLVPDIARVKEENVFEEKTESLDTIKAEIKQEIKEEANKQMVDIFLDGAGIIIKEEETTEISNLTYYASIEEVKSANRGLSIPIKQEGDLVKVEYKRAHSFSVEVDSEETKIKWLKIEEIDKTEKEIEEIEEVKKLIIGQEKNLKEIKDKKGKLESKLAQWQSVLQIGEITFTEFNKNVKEIVKLIKDFERRIRTVENEIVTLNATLAALRNKLIKKEAVEPVESVAEIEVRLF